METAAAFDFSAFPTLTTERLILREFRLGDEADLFAFRSDAEEQKYNDAPLTHVDEAAALIGRLGAEFEAHAGIYWAVTRRGDDRVIGLFGYGTWNTWHRHAEIGYDLARVEWGRGLATEALHAMISFGFTGMNLVRVEAQTIADNVESVRLLRRLGFQLEGIRRRFSLEDDGAYHDGAIYGLLEDELVALGRTPHVR